VTFFTSACTAADTELLRFAMDEFDFAFDCDILAHGLLRMRCAD
jgi:hypothetical protein